MKKVVNNKILLILFVIFISFLLTGCRTKSSYTEQEHIENVCKIIEKKYLKGDITYKLRPLYDYNDELSYFVVDFSDDTYIYIKIQEKDRSLLWGTSLYTKNTAWSSYSEPWRKSTYVEENGQLIEKFEKDDKGNDIYYKNSHFEVANINEETKCYLIVMRYSQNNIIPAIKKGDKFLNLITMEEFDIYSSDRYPWSGISFIPKADFNL